MCLADGVNGEGDFGDENHVRPAGDARAEPDPAGVAPHDLHDHDAMVRLRGGVDLVDRVGGRAHGGVEAEGDLGGAEIVVDGLGHAHDLHALLKQFLGDGLRSVAADGDHRINAQFPRIGHHFIGDIELLFLAVLYRFEFERAAAIGGAEDGAAAGQNAADLFKGEFERLLRPDQAVKAIGNADDLPLVLQDGGLHRGTNHCIEAGSISASGRDSDAANF